MVDTVRVSIPLFLGSESLGEILVSLAESNTHRYLIKRNRRKNPIWARIRLASIETEVALASNHRSTHGRAYEQHLSHGPVWALRGVRGSGR